MNSERWSAVCTDGGEIEVQCDDDADVTLHVDDPVHGTHAECLLVREQARDLGAWLLRRAAPEPAPEDAEGDVLAEVMERERGCLWAHVNLRKPGERLIGALEQRRAFGLAKYGKPLAKGNGRDHLRDALDELLDAMAYAHAAGNDDLYDSARSAALVALRAMGSTTHTGGG